MKKVRVQDRQSLIDIALQTSGGVESAIALALRHDIPITAELPAGTELETVAVVDRTVVERYASRGTCPTTELSPADLTTAPCGGIGAMGIGTDFKVR